VTESGFVQIPTAELDAILAEGVDDLARWEEHYGDIDVFTIGPGIRLWDPAVRLGYLMKRLSTHRSPRRTS
jgi:hypothetical protein